MKTIRVGLSAAGPAAAAAEAALTGFLFLLLAACGSCASGAGAVQIGAAGTSMGTSGTSALQLQCNSLQLEPGPAGAQHRLLRATANANAPTNTEIIDAAVESAGKAVRKFLLQRSGDSTPGVDAPEAREDEVDPHEQKVIQKPSLPVSLQDELNNRPLFAEVANLAEEDAAALTHADDPSRLEEQHPATELEPRIRDLVFQQLPIVFANIFADALEVEVDEDVAGRVGPMGASGGCESASAACCSGPLEDTARGAEKKPEDNKLPYYCHPEHAAAFEPPPPLPGSSSDTNASWSAISSRAGYPLTMFLPNNIKPKSGRCQGEDPEEEVGAAALTAGQF